MPVATWNDASFTWNDSQLDWSGNFSGTPTVDTNFKMATIAPTTQAVLNAHTVAVIDPTTVAVYRE